MPLGLMNFWDRLSFPLVSLMCMKDPGIGKALKFDTKIWLLNIAYLYSLFYKNNNNSIMVLIDQLDKTQLHVIWDHSTTLYKFRNDFLIFFILDGIDWKENQRKTAKREKKKGETSKLGLRSQ